MKQGSARGIPLFLCVLAVLIAGSVPARGDNPQQPDQTGGLHDCQSCINSARNSAQAGCTGCESISCAHMASYDVCEEALNRTMEHEVLYCEVMAQGDCPPNVPAVECGGCDDGVLAWLIHLLGLD